MVPGLLSHLSARFVFVVGKGGVGKSTTASAVALAMADSGQKTHLLSTDPAHSLQDLFGERLDDGRSGSSRCSERLTLEELDARRRARRWLDSVGEAVADLFDRGTYLDRDDVSALLDRSLSGIDEVMGALRIAELGRSDIERRVVVDTAPTGHTLRLLDSGRTLAGWVRAFDAMADKAGAVATALTGRQLRLQGEVVIDELRMDVARFTDEIVRGADFVVVTRDGPVVRDETVRLEDALAQRGCRIAGRVVVRSTPDDSRGPHPRADVHEVVVAHTPGLVGCAGIRRWGRARGSARGTGQGPEDPAHRPAPCPSVLDAVPARALTFFAGKGGVGKSTCAAAYAIVASARTPVLLLSLDPAGSLTEVLGQSVDATPRRIAPGLRASQLDAERAFARFRNEYRERVRGVFERLGLERTVELDRRVVESLLEVAPPGLDEIFALDAVLDGEAEGETLVVDTAPTGHFLRVLEMPEVAHSWARQLVRVILKYRSVLGLDDLAREVLAFSKRLGALVERMRDPERCGVVVVALDEELARRETDRLLGALRQRGTPLAALLHNRATGTSGPATPVGDGVPTLVAPELRVPPVGLESLRDFAAAWRCP